MLGCGDVDEFGHLVSQNIDLAGYADGCYQLASNRMDTVCLGYGDPSNLGENCRILAKPDDNCRKDQGGPELLGLATSLSFACRKCGHNAHNAMCNRHGVKQPGCVGNFTAFLQYLDDVEEMVRVAYDEQLNHYEKEWINKWPEFKRRQILESIWLDDIQADRVNNMVKFECYHKVPSKARCIQYYRNYATQAAFGPEFTSLQKAYTNVFLRSHGVVKITFASGMNSVQLGAWMSAVLSDVVDPHFYERDGKSWDATQDRTHMEVKKRAYRCAGGEFVNFVEKCFTVRGIGLFGGEPLKYVLEGTVKSGHNDTTLGNSIINAGIAFEVMTAMRLRGDIIVAGDDLLVVIAGDFDEHEFARRERDLGILPEYRKFDDVQDVSFISGMWFPTGKDSYLFTPKPGRLLARLFWTTKPPPPKMRKDYLHSVASGLLPTCKHVPIIGPFLRAHDPGGKLIDSVYREKGATFAHEHEVDVEHVTAAFRRKYGVTDSEIKLAEEAIRMHAGSIGILKNYVLESIMAIDLADISERPTVGKDFGPN